MQASVYCQKPLGDVTNVVSDLNKLLIAIFICLLVSQPADTLYRKHKKEISMLYQALFFEI